MPVTSMRGQKVDMGRLVRENGHKVAVGNAGLNARGDRIKAGGQVVQTREQIMTDYNVSNPKAVKQVGLNSIQQDKILTVEEAAEQARKIKAAQQAEQQQPRRRKISETDI